MLEWLLITRTLLTLAHRTTADVYRGWTFRYSRIIRPRAGWKATEINPNYVLSTGASPAMESWTEYYLVSAN
jgi:hypothetical protein